MKLGLLTVLALLVCVAGQARSQPEMRVQADAPACAPAALVSGEAALVADLQSALVDLGVDTDAGSECPVLHATVESVASGYFVSIKDVSGRHAYRRLGDLQVAATWIDSWLRDELSAPLLAARVIAAPAASASPSSPAPDASAPSLVAVTLPADARRVMLAGSLHYENANASDSIAWRGVRAELCAELGVACIGIMARFAQTSQDVPFGDAFSVFSQNAIDAMTMASLSFQLGRATLTPRLGLGLGRLASERKGGPACASGPAPLMPCVDVVGDSEPASRSSWAPRADAGLSLGLPLSSRLSVALGVSTDLRPMGARAYYIQSPGPNGGEPPMNTCPGNDPSDPQCAGEPPSMLAMPADPEFFWRLSLGVELRL